MPRSLLVLSILLAGALAPMAPSDGAVPRSSPAPAVEILPGEDLEPARRAGIAGIVDRGDHRVHLQLHAIPGGTVRIDRALTIRPGPDVRSYALESLPADRHGVSLRLWQGDDPPGSGGVEGGCALAGTGGTEDRCAGPAHVQVELTGSAGDPPQTLSVRPTRIRATG